MLKSCKMWYCILLAMMVTKGFYLQLCKQKYLIAIMHKKLSFAMFAFKSYRSFDAILQFFFTDLKMLCESHVLSSHKLVSNKFFRIFLTSVWHVSQRSYTCFFYRLLTCFVQFLNFFLTIHKHVSNKSRTCV